MTAVTGASRTNETVEQAAKQGKRSLMRSGDLAAYTVASDAVLLAEMAAKALWNVADGPFLQLDREKGRYTIPEGKLDQAKKAREVIGESLFACLDAPFRRFLSALGSERDLTEARMRWVAVVREQAVLVAGRDVAQWAAAETFTGALAEDRFRRELAKASKQFCPTDHEEG